MTCEAKVILASSGAHGATITTMQLRYWRAIHAEFMTHRVFSRNASSSRAIPVKKMLAQVWNDPAGPVHWGTNQPGMQARAELTGWRLGVAKGLWKWAGRAAVAFAWTAMKLGGHKQWVNRLLESWQYISVVVTATDWDNFFALRDHPDAQPEIRELAQAMWKAMLEAPVQQLKPGEWHIPYDIDWGGDNGTLMSCLEHSVACCARTSYNNHDGTNTTPTKDKELHNDLKDAEPPHMSPFEHQAMAMFAGRHANFNRFKSYRNFLETGGLPK